MADRVLRTTLDVQVRDIDEKSRSAEFVASTENPIRTWGDPEVLRVKGFDLSRYERNPVLLDTHQRYDLSKVIGSCSVRKVGRQLVARATYAKNEAGENAWQLVKDNHVRAMSIGYMVNPDKVTRLREGQFDGEGDARVEGPCTISNETTLLEISNVPVPADEDAVRRSFYDNIQEKPMPPENTSVIARAMVEPAPQVAQTAPVAPASNPAPSSNPSPFLTTREMTRRDVLAITPRGLEPCAEDCLLRGLDLEATRAVLLREHAKRYTPLGTPEAAPPTEPAKGLPDWLTDEVIVRSFENMQS